MENRLTPAEKYVEHFTRIFSSEPEYYKNESLTEGISDVTSLVFKDYPRGGLIIGVSYGFSLTQNSDSSKNRYELCICAESENVNWGRIAGIIANKIRGKFTVGSTKTLNMGKPVIEGSEMDAFFIHTPSFLDKSQYSDINIGLKYTISLAQIYPVYSSELSLINEIGIEKFMRLPNFDLFDLNRKKITSPE